MADLTPLPPRARPDIEFPAGLAVFGGAVLGGLAGYLLLTPRGARLRHDLDDAVDRLFGGVDSLLDGWQRARRRSETSDPSLPFDDADSHSASGDRARRRHSF